MLGIIGFLIQGNRRFLFVIVVVGVVGRPLSHGHRRRGFLVPGFVWCGRSRFHQDLLVEVHRATLPHSHGSHHRPWLRSASSIRIRLLQHASGVWRNRRHRRHRDWLRSGHERVNGVHIDSFERYVIIRENGRRCLCATHGWTRRHSAKD